jgi:hypothetical protein
MIWGVEVKREMFRVSEGMECCIFWTTRVYKFYYIFVSLNLDQYVDILAWDNGQPCSV